MKRNFGPLERKLSEIKKNNLLRTLQDSKIEKQYIKINRKKLLNFSSNDYLGIKPSKIKYSQFRQVQDLFLGTTKVS